MATPRRPRTHAPAILTYVRRPEGRACSSSASIQRFTDLIASKTTEIQGCVPSADHTCGRSSFEAPSPWVASNGERCFGHASKAEVRQAK